MKNVMRTKVAFWIITILFFCQSNAQNESASVSPSSTEIEANKRIDDYLKLLRLGYTEREIFEDLGNVNLLTENYNTAAFWYQKLMDISDDQDIDPSYYERYQFAMEKAGIVAANTGTEQKDWMAVIKKDYRIKKDNEQKRKSGSYVGRYKEIDFNAMNKSHALDELKRYAQIDDEVAGRRSKNDKEDYANAYEPPIAVTKDGRTAYFSKVVYVKPQYGIFSKKEKVYKIYKADRINGQWKNVDEVAVCPKYASAIHPTISEDGRRLFFASNMPGSFGEYDIYVSELKKDGNFGLAKNLGRKVNSEKNDLYPNIVNGTLLFFASDGREGYGGLDLYAAQVAKNELGVAVNLGNPINSGDDEFSLSLMTDRGMGYVMSNRGKSKEAVRQLVFSYTGANETTLLEKEEYKFLNVVNNSHMTGYSNTLFQD